jgi:hypothetical protein
VRGEGAVLDHAVINVRTQIDNAAEAYRRLGFTLTERGYHTIGTCNHLAVFQDNYLELLGLESEAKPVQTDLASGPIGLSALAFKYGDTAALQHTLSERHLAADLPQAFSRPVTLKDGAADARFEIIRLRGEASRMGTLFFCRHLTPELVWRAEWQNHSNHATAVVGIVVLSTEPTRSVDVFQRLAGPNSASAVEGGVAVTVGGAFVEVLSADAIRRRFGAAAPSSENDRMVAIRIQTQSLEAAEQVMRTNGVKPIHKDAQRIVVGSADAFGTVIEFVPPPHG